MGRPYKRKSVTDPHTPPELAAWAAPPSTGVAESERTAELTLTVTGRGSAWVCRLWHGGHCHGVGRAGVSEPGAREKAVERAVAAAREWAAARGRAVRVT